MLIEIRPIESKRWHGKQKEENFTRPKSLSALVDPNDFKYATGLSEEDKKYLESKGVNYDLSDNYNPELPHPFWDSSIPVLKLENSTIFLNTDKPLDYIKSKIAKKSKFIANSIKDYEEGLFPEASHVIFNEAEEAHVVAGKIALKNKANSLVNELSKDRKVQLLLILEGKNLKGQSDDFVLVELDKVISKQPKEIIRLIESDKEELAVHSLIIECLQKGVLVKKGHKIFFGDSNLGDDELTVVSYLIKPDNQELKLRLMQSVNQ